MEYNSTKMQEPCFAVKEASTELKQKPNGIVTR